MSNELKELKALVRRFLAVTASVPFRQIDLNCSQQEAYVLLDALHAASRPSKKRRKATK